ncbi:GH116 family glycosyl hydrolase [Sinomicrobium weinanense]|uniref:Beta-Glucocerebrosidase 2 N terminal n=1 Tax=Sinomicrobium weinanense TaxID=2842200 RepID=A0A926JR11_9FLAO|nr:GH116 family glycosyl hydrolase [Sinomicrobium weinanense]MBC9795719.1 hypothetical protein [Sinomicrobium weinanense]MBU3125282.1 hypothetical protein [Sinomicrobium weinanense]
MKGKKQEHNRRLFLKQVGIGGLGASLLPVPFVTGCDEGAKTGTTPPGSDEKKAPARKYNGTYKGDYLDKVAFPIGGMGAGMFALEGTGAISHMSIRHRPELYHEPNMFAAITVKGMDKGAKVLEGQVPKWKMFGPRGTGNGAHGSNYGLPRFTHAAFKARFPFASIRLKDEDLPLRVTLTGWSPFIPADEDNSGLPVGALEYEFENTGARVVEAVFSYNARNFVLQHNRKGTVERTPGGFILTQKGTGEQPHLETNFAVFTDEPGTVTDHCWFRGGWFDPLTMVWETIKEGKVKANEPVEEGAPGASLFVPFELEPGEKRTIRIMMAWYVPESDLHFGEAGQDGGDCFSPTALGLEEESRKDPGITYKPWYSSRFGNIKDVVEYWRENYKDLQKKSGLFRDAFYSSTLPPEVVEAIAANLTILKSPTVMRQYDGRMWNWEGCSDDWGCCHGTCTHVWNYAQAIPHLFPAMERGLRHTEFCENQNEGGHQVFRSNLPVSPGKHNFHSAADGQLGGIMKVYREWRISGNNRWLEKMYPMVKTSMDYCIRTWDPREKGVLEEPHHNTYDIEFWGPDGMCTSFYLGALSALSEMGKFLNRDISRYEELCAKGKKYMEERLYDGEYFIQDIRWTGLNAPDPVKAQSFHTQYSDEALAVLKKEGPKYQYGKGCLSDGVLGSWIASMCGLQDPLNAQKVRSHLMAVHKYNLKDDLTDHVNPQRPAYALGNEGGLLLCSWPKGGKLSLPFVYSNEVWTGIEYQVASHLMLMGQVEEGLEIVRACRDRYDGRTRNPFNEYECGSWYARALSSYGMLQGLTGVRYDAVERVLHIDSRIGDFSGFLSTENGFGTVSLKGGKPALKIFMGEIKVEKVLISGEEVEWKV